MADINEGFIISITVHRKAVPSPFLDIDWKKLVSETYPVVFDSPQDKNGRKSDLYISIQRLSKLIRVDFEDSAHWVLRRVLGSRYLEARRMHEGQIEWDEDLRYVCRIMSLQVCRYLGPKHEREMRIVDGMINTVLPTLDVLLQETYFKECAIH